MDARIEQGWQRAQALLGATPEQVEKGLRLHEKLFACDLFGFLPRTYSAKACEKLRGMVRDGATHDELTEVRDILGAISHVHDETCRPQFLEAVRASGLKCTVLTMGSEKDLHHSLQRMSWYLHLFDGLPEHVAKATCVADIERARRDGKLAVVCSTNCAPAHGGVHDGVDAHRWIDVFYRMGIRVMHLTYNRRNWVGDGCLEPADAGLSLHGRDVVRHLNQIGVVVDTPHSGRQTTLDAARLSKAPIMASHTVCRAVHDHPRGKTDEELRAIADTGGLIGICAVSYFLGKGGGLNELLDHVEHAAQVVGPDHVAIGTDRAYRAASAMDDEAFYAGYPKPSPYGAQSWWGAWQPSHLQPKPTPEQEQSLQWTNWPYFTVGLLARGHSEADIAKILGGNFLRVLRTVQGVADRPA